jgi:hypothetical protein
VLVTIRHILLVSGIRRRGKAMDKTISRRARRQVRDTRMGKQETHKVERAVDLVKLGAENGGEEIGHIDKKISDVAGI